MVFNYIKADDQDNYIDNDDDVVYYDDEVEDHSR